MTDRYAVFTEHPDGYLVRESYAELRDALVAFKEHVRAADTPAAILDRHKKRFTNEKDVPRGVGPELDELEYCGECGAHVPEDAVLIEYENREYWGSIVQEPVPVGYRCAWCNNVGRFA